MSFDFREVFTVAARHMIPKAWTKRLACSFDCQSEPLTLPGKPDGLRGALHRLFCASIELTESGFVAFIARSERTYFGDVRLTIHAGGVGHAAVSHRSNEIIKRLRLTPSSSHPSSQRETRFASGLCPYTDGVVQFSSTPGEGTLLTLEIMCIGACSLAQTSPPDARHARAWLVDVEEVMAQAWTHQLQRLGWIVSRVGSLEAARHQLLIARKEARPLLVIAMETRATTAEGCAALQPLLPRGSRLVYAVPAGSPNLRSPCSGGGFEVHVIPFSPNQLEAFTTQVASAKAACRSTQPIALDKVNIPLVLLVDDEPLNLKTSRELTEALGYLVETATDGVDAIQHCIKKPPDVVLTDLHMPRLGGIGTAVRLRALQKKGEVPPFSVIALTASWTPLVRAHCLDAGMDECLPRPISVELLGRELRRVCTLQ